MVLMPASHLFEGIACNGLEGLLYIDGFLSAGLKVGDVVLTLTPGLGPLGCHLCLDERKYYDFGHIQHDVT